MKISIVIPCYNRSKLLAECLDSVLAQGCEDWEAIVVDDGSTDETLEIAKAYELRDGRIKFLERRSEPKGAPTCRNIGLKESSGEYVMFLDSDDWLAPWCIERRRQKAMSSKAPDAVVSPGRIGRDFKSGHKEIGFQVEKDIVLRMLSGDLPFQTSGPMWKKSFIEDVGGWREGMPIYQEYDFHLRLLINEPKIEYLNEADYLIREHGGHRIRKEKFNLDVSFLIPIVREHINLALKKYPG